MRLFSVRSKPAPEPAQTSQRDLFANRPGISAPQSKESEVFSVRVFKGYKGEVLKLQAELQLARQSAGGRARRVTERQIAELMLSALQTMHRNGEITSHSVPVANDVWIVVHEISRRLGVPPSDVVEQLVAQKAAELDLVPRR